MKERIFIDTVDLIVNMKKILALLLLFGIVGCASKVYDNDFSGWNLSSEKIRTVNGPLSKSALRTYGYKVDISKSIVYVKMDGYILLSEPSQYDSDWKYICLSQFNTNVKGVMPKPAKVEKTFGSFYELPNQFAIQCQTQDESREIYENQLREIALRKSRVLEAKKSKCRTYGFKDNTDGMGLCLIELDKLDAIKNQATAANLAQSNLIAQQQAEAKKQREAQALINLGALIGGAGVPSTTSPKPVTPTYSNSYSTSRTVPSNQNCPLLKVPLKKQEVKGGNRICYY